MKCIAIRQPWAWLVVHGYKDIENRTWPSFYRGPILVYASSQLDLAAATVVREYRRLRVPIPPTDQLARGQIVGLVNVLGCVDDHESEWFCGPYGLVMANPIAFPVGVPLKGQPGIFDVDDALVPSVYLRPQPVSPASRVVALGV